MNYCHAMEEMSNCAESEIYTSILKSQLLVDFRVSLVLDPVKNRPQNILRRKTVGAFHLVSVRLRFGVDSDCIGLTILRIPFLGFDYFQCYIRGGYCGDNIKNHVIAKIAWSFLFQTCKIPTILRDK